MILHIYRLSNPRTCYSLSLSYDHIHPSFHTYTPHSLSPINTRVAYSRAPSTYLNTPLSFAYSLSLSHSHTNAFFISLSFSYTLTLSLSLSDLYTRVAYSRAPSTYNLSFFYTFALSLSFLFTHKRFLDLSLSLSHTHSLSLCFSLKSYLSRMGFTLFHLPCIKHAQFLALRVSLSLVLTQTPSLSYTRSVLLIHPFSLSLSFSCVNSYLLLLPARNRPRFR